ncbi:MAG: ACT domain-containing protein, partial [Desulfobacula sp.]|nr:ACT domain-containing protein [Desulfobacula sp.]
VSKKDIRKILAPPPAFSQCKNYLDQYPDIELVPVKATSSAVRHVKDSDDKHAAAIGSTMAAKIFNMNIMEESIEDNPRNYTRFAIIAKEIKGHKNVNKTSIIFSTGNKPGALFEVMKVFSEYQINLVKLESRPMLGKPWEYMFYADLEADIENPKLAPVMEKLQEKSENLRILGRY